VRLKHHVASAFPGLIHEVLPDCFKPYSDPTSRRAFTPPWVSCFGVCHIQFDIELAVEIRALDIGLRPSKSCVAYRQEQSEEAVRPAGAKVFE
jgi:hypothetical protein